MDKLHTAIPDPLKRVRVIYDNDVEIIDYLADLLDREPIHALHRFVSFGKRENACLLHNCKMDEQVILILYKAPFGINQGWHRLTMYSSANLRSLCAYFQRWTDVVSEKDNKDMHDALVDVVSLLNYQWACEQDEKDNVQANFLGH
jgi:hypothetical protein